MEIMVWGEVSQHLAKPYDGWLLVLRCSVVLISAGKESKNMKNEKYGQEKYYGNARLRKWCNWLSLRGLSYIGYQMSSKGRY